MYYFIMFPCSRHSSKFSWIGKGVEPQIKKKIIKEAKFSQNFVDLPLKQRILAIVYLHMVALVASFLTSILMRN